MQVQIFLTFHRHKMTLLFCYETVLKCLISVSVLISLVIWNSLNTALCTSPEASVNFLLASNLYFFYWESDLHPIGEIIQAFNHRGLGSIPSINTRHGLS